MNPISRYFSEIMKSFNDSHGIRRDRIESHILGYIVALELCGENIEANKCKAIYEKAQQSFKEKIEYDENRRGE